MNIKGQGHSLTLVQGHSDSTFSNFFSSETTRPNEAKFHVEPPWVRGTKVCLNGPGHMTKLAAMYIYVKNLKKSSSLEPKGRWRWSGGYSSTTPEHLYNTIVCVHANFHIYQVYSNDDTGSTLTYVMARSNLSRPIEAKFHVEPPWDGRMKVNTNGLCHMTTMAAMSIYGKSL